MTRVSIITTLDHNVGDDFVRDGIIHLIQKVVVNARIEMIHKHLPITARPSFTWLHSTGIDRRFDEFRPDLTLRVTRRIDSALPLSPFHDKIRNADILIQSGGPIYWTSAEGSCAQTEWWDPLIERRWIPFAEGKPFLNLAGGTCQRYDSDASEFLDQPKVIDHIRRFYDLTALTTLRDSLSIEVLRQAGRQGVLLPCTSLFAVDRLGITAAPGEYVVLNYMPTGGHFLLGGSIDAEVWEQRFVAFARGLAKREKVILVCHNQKESDEARRLLPEFQIFQSDNYVDYLRLYSRARWGLLNRVHGCFALASLGKPSAVVGSDSRAKMVRNLGLPEVFVNDATDDWLESTASALAQRAASFPEHMAGLKSAASAQYEILIRRALDAGGRAKEN
jgi:hypothetical protein